MTPLRWQRSFEAMFRRFTPQQSAGERFRELLPFVLPVLLLGCDRSDVERPMYVANLTVAAVAGQTPKLFMQATECDVELVAAWASVPGGAGMNLASYFVPMGTPGGPGLLEVSSSDGSQPKAWPLVGAGALVTTAYAYESPPGVTLQLPLAGTFIAMGRELVLEGPTGGATLRGGFAWRCLETR